ncbi:hypothetical protein [Fervidibacillus halotolerans]|uniref:Uncharacterized protein n=1 Tax=Fervidibacillus halotolerans TaxID=2980027 RepID=A0A9E8LYM1_9BACI|nr:hypothetical protein [Fervidibacillus halotolerans]WAA12145.1 hypothetical protein OE105_11290 [Fervidibacillus halotolerans]
MIVSFGNRMGEGKRPCLRKLTKKTGDMTLINIRLKDTKNLTSKGGDQPTLDEADLWG